MKTRSLSKTSGVSVGKTSMGMCCPVGEAREKFHDYNPMKMKPAAHEQFAPTPAEPVRQHAKMAGC